MEYGKQINPYLEFQVQYRGIAPEITTRKKKYDYHIPKQFKKFYNMFHCIIIRDFCELIRSGSK